MAKYFEEPEFVRNLAYLTDMFNVLNKRNRSLQGQRIGIISACEKLSGFKEKLQLWIRCIQKKYFVNFPSLQEKLKETASLHRDLVSTIVKHLLLLCTTFNGYFSCGKLQACDYWICNPFKLNLKDINDDSDIMEKLIDIRNNTEI